MTFADERLRALTRKQAILHVSLETWLEQTSDRNSRRDPAFQIHYLQTREVDRLMEGIRTLVASAVTQAANANAVIQRAPTLEAAVLAGCQIWEFFREKLSQRLDPGLRTFLRVGDELAWQCYRPVRALALDADDPLSKAPPLVYLNSSWSPFTVPRNRAFQAASVPDAFLRHADFRTALSRLPFPVIAVPWYQTTYLPDAVAICHEVGHSVEADFALTDQLAARIRAAVPDAAQAELWTARGSELFADFYGCLSVGPAFAWALANILLAGAASMRAVVDEGYPPTHSRMIFNAAVLEHLGFGAEADAFRSAWADAAGPTDRGTDPDARIADLIARQFVGGGAAADGGFVLRGRNLATSVGFTRGHHDEAVADANDLAAGGEAASADIRVLAAAAVLASRSAAFDRQERLLQTMRAACVDERRNAEAAQAPDAGARRNAHLADVGGLVARALLGDLEHDDR